MAGEPISGGFEIEFAFRVVPPKPAGSGRVWYKPNHRSFGAFIKSDQVKDAIVQVAESIRDRATASAPPPTRDTDHPRANYLVDRSPKFVKVSGNTRVYVEVVTDTSSPELARAGQSAEFGQTAAEGRYRNLARTALATPGADWKPIDKWK